MLHKHSHTEPELCCLSTLQDTTVPRCVHVPAHSLLSWHTSSQQASQLPLFPCCVYLPFHVAGEFCIVPEAAAPGGHRLVIDNNSGTYAPDSKQLHLMKDLFLANFPEMCVEVLPVGDRKLKQYQQQCPSRATA